MVEKQASSEIAQSRERFENWANDYFDGTVPVTPDEETYTQLEVRDCWQAWKAALRSSR